MTRRRNDQSPALYAYTAATILIGFGAVAWSSIVFQIDPAISLTQEGGSQGKLLGLVFWVLVGLLGGLRVQQLPEGHGVLTFHLPFIIAAMALGGPTAGAIVALVSTIEARELRASEVPWYGTLANHAALAFAAVLGGVVMLVVRQSVDPVALEGQQAVDLVAIVLGSLVFALTVTFLVAGTVVLRDKLRVGEAGRVFDDAFRTTAAAEVILGWLLWMTYSMVAWWAALICVGLIVVIWKGFEAMERARHDPMTGLLSRIAFNDQLRDARNDAIHHDRISALVAIDLDGFSGVNNKLGHDTGDEVIREVGRRLKAAVRLTDAAVRMGGDEFAILYTRLSDRADARMLSERVHHALCEPMVVNGKSLAIGASIGCLVIDPDVHPMPSVRQLHDLADKRMYIAKVGGGGIISEPGPDVQPMTFAKRRRKTDRQPGRQDRPAGDVPPAEA